MDETAAQGSASAGVRRMPAGCALARAARGGSSDATRAAERRHPPLVPCIGPANPRPLPSTVTPRTGRDRAFTPHPAASALREGWRDCDCTPYPAVPSLAARLWGLLPCPSCDIMWSVRRDGEALGWPSADLGRDLGRLSGGPRRARRRSVRPTHVRVEGGSLGRSRPISVDLGRSRPISRRSLADPSAERCDWELAPNYGGTGRDGDAATSQRRTAHGATSRPSWARRGGA